MTFKAEILKVGISGTINEINKPTNRVFKFSRGRIFFTEQQKKDNLFLEPPSVVHSTISFKHGIKYSFDKVYDDNDKLVFQITVGANSFTSPLKIDSYNRFKCNLLHKRYFVQRKKEELYKIIFAAIVGALISAISTTRGYDKGYSRGYENGLQHSVEGAKDTILKKK